MKSLAFSLQPEKYKKFLEQAALANFLRTFAPAFEFTSSPVLSLVQGIAPPDLHNSEGTLVDSCSTLEFHYDGTKHTLYFTILRKPYSFPFYIIEAGLREEIDSL